MAGIPESDIQRIRQANDLVELFGETTPLRQKGRDFWCCCPFHDERSPSCKVDPAAQLWHCFGCGEGGDLFEYIMKRDGVGFLDAVRYLADRAHIDISTDGGPRVSQDAKTRLRQVCAEAAQFYHTQLMRGRLSGAAAARSYLSQRGFSSDVCKSWTVGYAPGSGSLVAHLSQKGFTSQEMIDANVALVGRDGSVRDRFYNRVMFPISDVKGECVAFGGRVLDASEPKYLNSQETPIFHKSDIMFGLHKAKASMASSGTAVVVEGYTDVISLHEAGITNVVATLGTALTRQHIRLLSRHAKHKIIYLFDGDEAGMRAADRALEFIDMSMTPEAGRRKIEIYAAVLPDALDPSDFVAERGAQALHDVLEGAVPLLEYGIERRLSAYDLSRPESKQKAVLEALAVLAPIKESLLAKEYAVRIAGRAHVREEDVLEMLEGLRAPRDYTQQAPEAPRVEQAPALELTQAQKNRRITEAQFLAVFVRNLALAPNYFAPLASTQWQTPLHAFIAERLLEVLSERPDITSAELIGLISQQEERAARLLTSARIPEGSDPMRMLDFFAEELALSDLEETIAEFQRQLKYSQTATADEYEMLFETVIGLQKEVHERRLRQASLLEA